MKISNLGIIFVIIVFPMFFHSDARLDEQRSASETIIQYDWAIRTAVQDAGVSLTFQEAKINAPQYDSYKNFKINKEEALRSFYKSLYINLGISDDELAQEVMQRYIPAIAVVAYDGYWIYTEEKMKDQNGENVIRTVWKEKKPYSYSDAQGNSVGFTLDDYVFAYDATTSQWYEGPRDMVSQDVNGRIPLLNDPSVFDQVRRTTIVTSIQKDLAHFINAHNQYSRLLGISYTFTLPEIDQEEWNNTISDVSFLAFIQGLPVGQKQYNRYAFGGGRLIKTDQIYGAEQNGIRIYYRSSECNYPQDQVIEKFTSEKAAAAAGYFPRRCTNGR
ncbi:hypothetical protein M5X00_13385 [Paenibacillus alvei]|uniref:hypothetical protein n=1 Tax=Paenibacillus alvei TaxID=44250 RepID=UPI0002898B80|nr:hypothetical protein [Paenibacillus alvei]EJW13877.1 hypothetical protein PAV_109p01070 [Paenibacillus alvei DSM 29]MCY9540483.1 hypothetical protein [Paenibacillus alvei]MCY9708312.1 hypothetical protein [Paenibacillus alvei]MCY9733000.1 hypothetical protein [Paenibacillus alvei]MCY9755234.1 hypothetical protein [Paenibacillus alvei]